MATETQRESWAAFVRAVQDGTQPLPSYWSYPKEHIVPPTPAHPWPTITVEPSQMVGDTRPSSREFPHPAMQARMRASEALLLKHVMWPYVEYGERFIPFGPWWVVIAPLRGTPTLEWAINRVDGETVGPPTVPPHPHVYPWGNYCYGPQWGPTMEAFVDERDWLGYLFGLHQYLTEYGHGEFGSVHPLYVAGLAAVCERCGNLYPSDEAECPVCAKRMPLVRVRESAHLREQGRVLVRSGLHARYVGRSA